MVIDTNTNVVKKIKEKNTPTPRHNHSCVSTPDGKELIFVGGRTKKGIMGDIHRFSIASKKWVEERDVGLDERMNHKSFFYGKWLVLIGGEGRSGNSGMVWVDSALWSEGLVREHGNRPFGLSRFAQVQVAETTLLVYGGTESTTRSPFATTYVVDLQAGNVERGRLLPRPRRVELDEFESPPADDVDTETVALSGRNRSATLPVIAPEPAPAPPPEQAPSAPQAPVPPSAPQELVPPSVVAPVVVQEQPTASSDKTEQETPPKQTVSFPRPAAADPLPVRGRANARAADVDRRRTMPTSDVGSLLPATVSPRAGLGTRAATTAVTRPPAGPGTPQSVFCESIGIDLSALTPFESRAAQMKLRRLMQLTDENTQLDATLQQKLVQASGIVPPDVPYFIKVFDDASQETRIIKVTTSVSVEELRTLISTRLEREAAVMNEAKEPLDADALRRGQVAVLSKSAFALTIVAL
jgi:hypothetical protein